MPTSRQVLGIRALACGELKLRPLGRKAVRGSGPAGADNGDRTGGVVQHGLAHRSEQQYFSQALRAGAAGYALIRNYLNRVRLGQAIPEQILTAREEEVLRLVAEGHSSKEIAETLPQRQNGRAAPANMLQKLGLRDRLELARYAVRAGLIEPWARQPRIGDQMSRCRCPATSQGDLRRGSTYLAPTRSGIVGSCVHAGRRSPPRFVVTRR